MEGVVQNYHRVRALEPDVQDVVRSEVTIEDPSLARHECPLLLDPLLRAERVKCRRPELLVQFYGGDPGGRAERSCEGALAGTASAQDQDSLHAMILAGKEHLHRRRASGAAGGQAMRYTAGCPR